MYPQRLYYKPSPLTPQRLSYKPSPLTPQRLSYTPSSLTLQRLPYNILRYILPKVVKTRIEIAEVYLKSLMKQHLLSFSEDDRGKCSPMKFFSAAKDSQPYAQAPGQASRSSPILGDVDMDI